MTVENPIKADSNRTIRRVTNVAEMKAAQAENYRYWQGRTIAERMEAIAEIARGIYLTRGIDVDTLPSNKTLVRIERPVRNSK